MNTVPASSGAVAAYLAAISGDAGQCISVLTVPGEVVADFGQSNFGQSTFGQPIWSAKFGQSIFGQSIFVLLVVLLCVVVCCCVCVCCWCVVGVLLVCCWCVVGVLLVCCWFGPSLPTLDPPPLPYAGPPLRRTAQNVFFFSPSPAPIFAFFVSLGVFSSNCGGVFEGRSPQMCPFGLSGCRVKPRLLWGFTRQPENSKRAHLSFPAFKNTTKIPRKDTQRERHKE